MPDLSLDQPYMGAGLGAGLSSRGPVNGYGGLESRVQDQTEAMYNGSGGAGMSARTYSLSADTRHSGRAMSVPEAEDKTKTPPASKRKSL